MDHHTRGLFFDAAKNGNLQKYELYAPHQSDRNIIDSLDDWIMKTNDPRVIDYLHRTRSAALANTRKKAAQRAVFFDRPEILRRLVRYYPDILTAKSPFGHNSFMHPGHSSLMHHSYKSPKSLGALMNMAPNLVKSVDHYGKTPVHEYVDKATIVNANILNRMHAIDSDAFARRTPRGQTPLHMAAKRLFPEAVQTMVHKMNKSNRLAKDKTSREGRTAWDHALERHKEGKIIKKNAHLYKHGRIKIPSQVKKFYTSKIRNSGTILKTLAYKDPEVIERYRLADQKYLPQDLYSLEPKRQLEVAKVLSRLPQSAGKMILGHAGEWDKMWYDSPSTVTTAKPVSQILQYRPKKKVDYLHRTRSAALANTRKKAGRK